MNRSQSIVPSAHKVKLEQQANQIINKRIKQLSRKTRNIMESKNEISSNTSTLELPEASPEENEWTENATADQSRNAEQDSKGSRAKKIVVGLIFFAVVATCIAVPVAIASKGEPHIQNLEYQLSQNGACTKDLKVCPGGYKVGRDPAIFCKFSPCPEVITCPLDVKTCPDGTTVGRVAPLCSFEACPSQNYPVMCTMEVKECPDGSFVGRAGPDCEFEVCPSATGSPVDQNNKNQEPAVPSTVPPSEPIMCTKDVKECPDGSSVGRAGPDCEFEACPSESHPVMCTMEVKECPDGSSVGRAGPDCEFEACPSPAGSPVQQQAANTMQEPAIQSQPMSEICPTPGAGMACPMNINPVKCGTDHQCVYDNECLANAAGFVGCVPEDCPAPGTGVACPANIDPVNCGTNLDCVYDNSCLANAAGFVNCLPVNPPVEPCNPTTGANCPPSATTVTSRSATPMPPIEEDTCPTPGTGMACPMNIRPVACGNNHQCVYDNDCLANAAGFAHCLPIEESCPTPGPGMACPMNIDHVKCGTHYQCVYDNACLANAAGFVGCIPAVDSSPQPCNPTTGANCPLN
jgi:hypothetical protein